MHSSNQKSKRTIILLGMILNLLLIILVACGPSSLTEGEIGVKTWTPSPTKPPPTATCADIPLSTPEGWGSKSRLIVILFDPKAAIAEDLSYENGDKTSDISSFIHHITPKLIKPSNQVSVFQLGYSKYEAARVTRLYSFITPAPIFNTPAPRNTFSPLSTVDLSTPGFEAVKAKNEYKVTSTALALTQTADAALFNCEINFWNNNVKLTATAWNGTATAEISGISEAFTSDISNFKENTDTIEEPFTTDELLRGGLYYGLNFATIIFQNECKNYDVCDLVIVDDMHHWGLNNPQQLPIDLENVNAYVIMPNCTDIFQPDCKSLQEYWIKELIGFNANEEIKFWDGDRAEINLQNAIGRQ